MGSPQNFTFTMTKKGKSNILDLLTFVIVFLDLRSVTRGQGGKGERKGDKGAMGRGGARGKVEMGARGRGGRGGQGWNGVGGQRG